MTEGSQQRNKRVASAKSSKRSHSCLIAFGVCLFVIGASMPPVYAYAEWNLPSATSGYAPLDSFVTPHNNPVQATGQVAPAYFYAHQFSLRSNQVPGYIGLLNDVNGKKAVFSIWAAIAVGCSNTDPIGSICQPFGHEGSGMQTFIQLNWQPDHTYQLRVAQYSTNEPDGDVWIGTVRDQTTAAPEHVVGYIKVPKNWGRLANASGNWVEYYGPSVSACNRLPSFRVTFWSTEGISSTGWATGSLNGYHGVLGGSGVPSSCTMTATPVYNNDGVLHTYDYGVPRTSPRIVTSAEVQGSEHVPAPPGRSDAGRRPSERR